MQILRRLRLRRDKKQSQSPACGRKLEISRKGWPSHEIRNPKLMDLEKKVESTRLHLQYLRPKLYQGKPGFVRRSLPLQFHSGQALSGVERAEVKKPYFFSGEWQNISGFLGRYVVKGVLCYEYEESI